MTFVFRAGPPKECDTVTLLVFKQKVRQAEKPVAAKDIGEGYVKILMEGDGNNYAVKRTSGLERLLTTMGIEIY